MMKAFRCSLILACIAVVASFNAIESPAKKPERWSNLNGIAIKGYDPAAFFLVQEPRRGNLKFTFRYDGANWIFENPENQKKFQQNAEEYAPQFGGYDVTLVADGKLVDPNPANWQLFNGKLFLFSTPETREAFLADPAGTVDRAVQKWSTLFGSSDR